MNAEEALAVIESAIQERHLTRLQTTLFCQVWDDRSYLEIAREFGYEVGYLKKMGSQLWQLLSEALGEKVNKNNLQSVLKRYRQRSLALATTQVATVDHRNSPDHFPDTFSHYLPDKQPDKQLDKQNLPTAIPVNRWRSPSLAAVTPSLLHDAASVAESPANSHLLHGQPVIGDRPRPKLHQDWGDAPDVNVFYDRVQELDTLQNWVVGTGTGQPCRLIGVFGMGGIGKTTLATKLAQRLIQQQQGTPPADHAVEFVIWRSLRNAPPIADLLADLLQFLGQQQPLELADSVDQRMLQLLQQLRRHRCLVILDNVETVMQPGDRGGGYQPGYDGYGHLLRCIAETAHRSTIILTSRERPKGLSCREGDGLPVRALRLSGLTLAASQALFQLKGQFSGSPADWQVLIGHYAGNPLALKMIAPVIQDFFGGNITGFLAMLQQRAAVFGDVRDLLTAQISRLSPLEQQVMVGLAIHRQPLTLPQLQTLGFPHVACGDLLEALTALERRGLIDQAAPVHSAHSHGVPFTLQPVVMEYMTERLIEQVVQELQLPLDPYYPKVVRDLALLRHALLHATAQDYIREMQRRFILQPVLDQLLRLHHRADLVQHWQHWLGQLRSRSAHEIGYLAGNLINLLGCLGADLTGWDLSGLHIQQADLGQMPLYGVKLTGATLSQSVFRETFSQILSVAFSPDGSLLATGDVNHEIHLWRVEDGSQLGQQVLTCRMEAGWVWSVVFSPDGRTLASSANRTIQLWDVATGTCVQTLTGCPDRIFCLGFSPDGRWLVSGGEDHLVRVWDLQTGELQHLLVGHTDEVRSLAIRPTSQREHLEIATASYDGTIRLWDGRSGTCVQVLTGHTGKVAAVAWSADGRWLASGGSDRQVKLWNPEQGTCVQSCHGHSRRIRSVVVLPPNSANAANAIPVVASGSDDQTVRLWDSHTGDCLRVLHGHASWIAALAVSPTGLLASGSEDQSVRLWQSQTGHCLKTIQGHSNGVWSIACNPKHPHTLASGHQDRTVRLWQLDQPTAQPTLVLQGHSSWVWSVAFSSDGQWLATGSEDRTIRIWQGTTGRSRHTLKSHIDAVFTVLFSPDPATPNLLFSGSLDGTIKLWHAIAGTCDQTWHGHTGGVWCLAISADGRWLVSGSQDQTIKIWEVATGVCLRTLTAHASWMRSVAITPDGRTLISGGADGVIKLWDFATGECRQTLIAHDGPVLAIAVHPDGHHFASSGTDATVKLWTLQGDCQHELHGHERWVRFLTYHPTGHRLISCSQDETIKVWDIAPRAPSCLHTFRLPRPYEGMDITHATGLTVAQVATLKQLGAVTEENI